MIISAHPSGSGRSKVVKLGLVEHLLNAKPCAALFHAPLLCSCQGLGRKWNPTLRVQELYQKFWQVKRPSHAGEALGLAMMGSHWDLQG